MKILFISLVDEADHIRDMLRYEWRHEIIEIPTDYIAYREIFEIEQPQAVFIRFLGGYSHRILMHLRNTGIPTKVIAYTFEDAVVRVAEMTTQPFDGYFHLQMPPTAIMKVFDRVMQGHTMLHYNEKEL